MNLPPSIIHRKQISDRIKIKVNLLRVEVDSLTKVKFGHLYSPKEELPKVKVNT